MVLFVLCLASPRDEAGNEAKKLAGTWQVVSAAFDGKALPADQASKRQLVFDGNQFISYSDGKKGNTLTFQLTLDKKPAWIEVKRSDLDEAALGIYRLEDDKLELCYGEPGKPRPTKFGSEAGSKVFHLVLKRGKKP
jgi:uncharacterized protein (TIGR03067 family)